MYIKMSDAPTRRELEEDYKLFWDEMKPYVAVAVEESFSGDGSMDTVSKAEVNRRVKIATDLVHMLRREGRWSKFRIRDNIGMILRAKISGIELDLNEVGKTMGRRRDQ